MYAICPPILLFVLMTGVTQPEPKESVGPAAPKDKNGQPDYEAGLNDQLGKGIAPEKNAVVLLWKALGPAPEGGTGMPAEFFKRLGMEAPAKSADNFVSLHNYMKDTLKLEPGDFAAVYDQQGRATQRPWAAKDFPHIANWLKVNEKAIAIVIEATQRPQYYNPLVSRKTEKDQGSLIGVLLPAVQKCRELAAALTGRAMLRAGEGKFDEAWQDLLASHRLGRLSARGATLIEALVGIAIEAIATNADLAYLSHAKLTAQQARDRLKDLQALPPLASMADKVDVGERYMYFDSLQLIRRGGVGQLEGLANGKAKKPTPDELKALAMIDWVPALKGGEQWYDRMVAAMRLKDRAAREKEFDKIEEDMKALKKDAAGSANLAKLVLGKDPPDKMVGKAIGDILIGLLMPAIRKVQSARDRAEQVERNLHVAFALAAYRADEGKYPAKLADLAPKYLKAVPDDLFSGKALVYRPAENGYIVYSIGVNGKDEEGRWVNDEPPGDDPRVRMPLPELKPNP